METPEENKTEKAKVKKRNASIFESQRRRIKEIVWHNESPNINRYPFIANSRSLEERIRERAKAKKEELANQAFEQDMKLKKTTLNRLFVFLSAETIVIFLLAIFQGFGWFSFYLEEWSFRLLVVATISQITIMLQFAVKHLFPQT